MSKSASRLLGGATLAVLVAYGLQQLGKAPSATADVKEDLSPLPALRRAIAEQPGDGALNAQLALVLLQPVDTVAPNTDEDSLYGPDFTLHHPNVAESRQAMERALKLAPNLPETHLAHQAVLMAEGNGEEAIQPGRKAVELAPTSADAYIALARSHLLAACAQGCNARQSLRAEKKDEKKRGRKSPLEAREEEAAKSQKRQELVKSGQVEKHKMNDRGSLRAGAMWRVMEAGRLFQQGADAEPTSELARDLAGRSRQLTHLDGFKVLNTEQIIKFGQCHLFFGQEVDGSLCDKARYKYE